MEHIGDQTRENAIRWMTYLGPEELTQLYHGAMAQAVALGLHQEAFVAAEPYFCYGLEASPYTPAFVHVQARRQLMAQAIYDLTISVEREKPDAPPFAYESD